MYISKHISKVTVRPSRHFFFSPDFIFPLLLFIATLAVFWLTDLDLQIQGRFFHPAQGWYLRNLPFFKLLYLYGNFPALLVSVLGLVLLGLSFHKVKFAKWRKIGLFLVLTMLLAPGLMINTVLKDGWGRPRPRNTSEFGGSYRFEKLLSIDPASPGKSFPSGHASMGFYLFVPWFLLRKKRKTAAVASLVTGVGAGLAIGMARVAQGGHFASDVIVAGLIVYWIGGGLYYLLNLHRSLWHYPKTERIDRSKRVIVGIVVSVLVVFLIFGVVLATPYSDKHAFTALSSNKTDIRRNNLFIDIPAGQVSISDAEEIEIASEVAGFGFPRSKLVPAFGDSVNAGTLWAHFRQKKKGYFTELDNKVQVLYPFRRGGAFDLNLDKGRAVIVLPEESGAVTLNLTVKNGVLDLDLPSGFKPRISLKGDFALADSTGFNYRDDIYIKEDFRVNLIVETGQIILR